MYRDEARIVNNIAPFPYAKRRCYIEVRSLIAGSSFVIPWYGRHERDSALPVTESLLLTILAFFRCFPLQLLKGMGCPEGLPLRLPGRMYRDEARIVNNIAPFPYAKRRCYIEVRSLIAGSSFVIPWYGRHERDSALPVTESLLYPGPIP